jgi:hypothetical protein
MGVAPQPALSYGYDALGEIISKSDTGSYSYVGSMRKDKLFVRYKEC